MYLLQKELHQICNLAATGLSQFARGHAKERFVQWLLCNFYDINCARIRSGPGKPNQRKVSSWTFRRGIPEQKFNVNRACFPKEKHQNSQKWAKFMNFSFWPFFGLVCRGDSWKKSVYKEFFAWSLALKYFFQRVRELATMVLDFIDVLGRVLAHQNRTIAIASDFRVDWAKSPEIPQKKGVWGSEIAARNRKSLATFHRTLKSQCSVAFSCLRNRAISGVRDGHRNRKSQKSLWPRGPNDQKNLISIKNFDLDRNFWSRSKFLISTSRFPHEK